MFNFILTHPGTRVPYTSADVVCSIHITLCEWPEIKTIITSILNQCNMQIYN